MLSFVFMTLSATSTVTPRGDVNGDGIVDVADGVVAGAGDKGEFWSSSFSSGGTAYDVYIYSGGNYSWSGNRNEGKTVRPVHQN